MKINFIIILSVFFSITTVVVGGVPHIGLFPLDSEAEIVADLILGMYASKLPVKFVERSRFRLIERELRRNRSGLTSGEWMPNPKELQNAELFAIIHAEPDTGQKQLSLTLFDGRFGIRLIDSIIPGKKAVEQASAVASMIRTAAEKRQKLYSKGILKLAFMPLVPINLTPEQLAIAKQAERMITRNSMSRPETLVLERRHLRMLLDEPGSVANKLTRQLAAGSLLVRLTCSPAPDNKTIILSLSFAVPGKAAAPPIKLTIDPAKELAPQLQNALSKLPAAETSDNRKAEAKEHYRQAYFALTHCLDADATAIAADSAALNRKQEMVLADICIRTSARMLGSWGSIKKKKTNDIIIRNLKIAAKILKKNDCFCFSAMRLCGQWGYLKPQTFVRLAPEQQQDMREVISSFLHQQYRELEKCNVIDMMNRNRKTISGKFIRMGYLAKYLNSMDYVANQQWDLSYYRDYIIPPLKEFIELSNTLVPEMEKFYDLTEVERRNQYGRTKLEYLQNSHLGRFFNADLAEQTEDNKAVFRDVFTLLARSKILDVAWRGHLGFLRLKVKEHRRNGIKKCPQEAAEFNAALVRCFETCSFPEGSNSHLELSGPITQDTRWRIQELAMERYAFYNPMNGSLLDFQWRKNIPPKDAPAVQQRLFEYLKKYRDDKRVDASGKYYSYNESQLKGALLTIENMYDLPSLIDHRKIPKSPYSRIIKPFDKLNGRITQPCFDGRYIIFAILGNDMTQLVKLDTENNFAPSYGTKRQKVYGWCGTAMNGCLNDKYYIAQNYKYVYLYPLDGGPVQELEFGGYYEGRNICMTCIGDRLFLSYGKWAGNQRPGTVLEYNIATKKTKVIVSTLDKSVNWPLRKQNWPYHIHQLVPDPKHRRVLMLIHSGFFHYGFSAPPMKLYAYYYDSGKWEALSGGLPIFTGDSGKIFLDNDDIYILARRNGFGKIRSDKIWQPFIMKEYRDQKLTRKMPSMPKKESMAIDYSHPVVVPGIRWNIDHPSFLTYSDGILYGRNVLIDFTNKFYFPFRESFYPHVVFGRKYALNWTSYSTWNNALTIAVLKSPEELRHEAVK